MRRRMMVGAGAVVVGLVAAGVAAGALRSADDQPARSNGTTLVTGFHEAGEKFDLGGRTIDRGRYTAGYSLEVRVLSPMPDLLVECMLVDLSGQITGFDQPEMLARANGEWVELKYEDVLELPDATLSIRCSPTVTGELSASFRNVRLIASKETIRDRD